MSSVSIPAAASISSTLACMIDQLNTFLPFDPWDTKLAYSGITLRELLREIEAMETQLFPDYCPTCTVNRTALRQMLAPTASPADHDLSHHLLADCPQCQEALLDLCKE